MDEDLDGHCHYFGLNLVVEFSFSFTTLFRIVEQVTASLEISECFQYYLELSAMVAFAACFVL